MFGDHLPGYLRQDLKEMWGYDTIRMLYGTVEAGVVAIAEDDTNKLVPLLDRFILEIVPEEAEEPVDVRDVDQERSGSLLISDPERDILPFKRYEIGDIVRVEPGDVPRLEVLGREDNAINLGGALLHERQIHAAIADTYGEEVEEWRAVVSREGIKPAIDFYVAVRGERRQDEFLRHLFDRAPPVKEAYEDVGEGVIDHLALHIEESAEELREDIHPEQFECDVKANRILFDESYRED